MHKGKEKVLYNPRVTFWTYYRKSAGRDLCRVCKRNDYRGFGQGNLRERDHLQDLGVDESIILIYLLKK